MMLASGQGCIFGQHSQATTLHVIMPRHWHAWTKCAARQEWHYSASRVNCGNIVERKEKTTPFGVNSMRSQVIYRAVQAVRLLYAVNRSTISIEWQQKHTVSRSAPGLVLLLCENLAAFGDTLLEVIKDSQVSADDVPWKFMNELLAYVLA